MAQATAPRHHLIGHFRTMFTAVVLFVCLLGLWLLAVDVRRQIDSERAYKQDNVQWSLSQIEFELSRMLLTTDQAQRAISPLDEVRHRFDLFYSRVATMKQGSLFKRFRTLPDYVACVAPFDQFFATYLPLMDGPDAALRAGLPNLLRDSTLLEKNARKLSFKGLAFVASANDLGRAEVEQSLNLTAGLTLIFITTLLGLIFVLLRLDRINQDHADRNLQTLARLDATVATAQEAIITINAQGRIVDFNAAATQTFGFTKAEAMGRDFAALITDPSSQPTIFRTGLPPVFDGPGQMRLMMRHKAGHGVPVELSMSQTSAGDAPLYVSFLRDLTQQLATERDIVAARDKALAGEQAKSDLLVVMSHEIRTPLNGMIGTIELLGDTTPTPQQAEYLRILAASGRLLMHHVNDVLDIARLDSGRATSAPDCIDLTELVQEVLENQTPAARKNANTLRFSGPADGRSTVMADGALLRQVLLNLVGNAVKFTQRGEILVTIAHLSATGSTVISVADTGIGIAPADLDRIFDDFVTLDASYARKVSGTGLGLGIVRRIVGRIGGTMTVESQPGLGSIFRLTLPLPILDPVAHPSPAVPQPARPLETLVIEDNEFNRVIMRDMLHREGHDVVEARDGLEGIVLAGQRRFDLILMDISMPRIDGFQATRAIRQGSGASRESRIIAMTAHAQTKDDPALTEAGLNGALIKPITRLALQTVIAGGIAPAAPYAGALLVDFGTVHAMTTDLGAVLATRLLDKFLAETTQSIAALVHCHCDTGLDDTSLREVHRLEGSAAMFGALALRNALAQIQKLQSAGAMVDLGTQVADLHDLWQRTRQAYAKAATDNLANTAAGGYREVGLPPQLSSLR